MSLTRYLIGVVLLAIVVLSVGGGAKAVRARLLPGWSGPPALLVDVVLSLTTIIGLAEILGTVGLFRLVPMVVGAVACGGAGRWWSRRQPASDPERPDVVRAPVVGPSSAGRSTSIACCVAVAVLTASWATQTVFALLHGVSNTDSIWYHLPVAARFVQEGAVTDVHYLDGALTAFYPASTPLLHGLAMMLLGSDLLSPILNLGFLALALLAAWCLGRPFGVAPATLVGAAAVLGTPMLATTQPGGAYNDIVGIAFFIAALAILASADPLRGPIGSAEIGMAALAAGLALGTKYQFILPVIALTFGVVAIARSGERVRRAVNWLVPVALAGGFFYVRNLLVVGNPVPPVSLSLGPLSLPSPPLRVEQIAPVKVLGNTSLWDPIYLPGLRAAFGPAWWLLLALVGAGLVLSIAAGRGLLTRILGAVALVTLAGYVFTPASLGTKQFPIQFVYSLRYGALAFVLAVVLLPLVPAFAARRTWYPIVACVVALAVTQLDPGIWPTELHRNRFAQPVRGPAVAIAIAVGVAVFAIGIALVVARGRFPAWKPRVGVLAVVVVFGLVAGGAAVHRVFVRDRYADASYLPLVDRWARDRHDERIALVGTPLQYPLYGSDRSNYVQYVGERGPHGAFARITECATWRRALNAGKYTYVLTAPSPLLNAAPIESLWTRSDPATAVVLRDGFATMFRINGTLDPSGCRRLGKQARIPPAAASAGSQARAM